MAKTPTEDGKRPRGAVKEVAVWTLMGMLILGLGGFGVTSFSGGVTRVASVGDIDVTTDDYARALQTQVNAFSQQLGQQLSMQEALAFGIDKQVLQDVLTRAALDNEAQRVGLSVGDGVVAAELMGMDAFKGVSGSFDREAYRFALDRNNLSETEFETNLRRDISRELLQGAVAGGFAAPAPLTETLYAWVGERRGFSMLRLGEGDLTAPVAEPTDDELKAHYDAQLDRFTKPEAKRITYAALLPEAIAKDQPVDDATLQKLYQDRISEFVIPERRIVERLVYPDQAAAEAAKAKLDAGTSFEDLVAERGLTLDAIDMGDMSKEELGAAGEAVFATAEGQVAGPAESDLGPALYRVVSVLAAEETSFEDARETLAIEIQTDAARRLIADQVESIDDLLAGGATLEDLGKEMGLAVATIDYVPGQQGEAAIEGYPAFREAADAVQEGDFAEAVLLDDGGVVALRLDEIVPAAPIPFDEAKDQVAEDWRKEATTAALAARAAEIKAEVEGGAAIGSFGIVDVTPETARSGFVANAPETLVADVFKMAEGEVKVMEAPGFVAVVKLDRILPAATEGEDAEATREALAAQARQAIAQDAFAAFTNALTAEAGISLDQAAINAVHTSLP
ncbi:SurA N-terminal domain-containing protein [Tabrizicola sp.]|uniref:peptidylprolyl isomerase n=1 Tax=Tabrizicola sp. TaxID=2005166 RepID=UPI0035B3A99F